MPNYSHQRFPEVLDKLWANTTIDPQTNCHLWQGHTAGDGYGTIRCDNQDWYIHRLVYREFICSEVPEVVRHTCDIPNCWNYEHLVGGTHNDNVQDKVQKDRHLYGTKHYKAALDEEKVREIRSSTAPNEELAKKYNVTRGAIHGVRSGNTWKHVQ